VATGTGDDIEASGASPAALITSLSGATSVKAVEGAILDVNLEEALRRSRRRAIDVDHDMRLGGTAFDQLAVSLSLLDGRARVEHGAMTSHGVTADLSGLIDLVDSSWSLRLSAVQTNEVGEESQDAARLALDIDGPWSAPTIRAIGTNGSGEPADER
jgi:uncharacterized protein involved in outer membrane biogenesis